MVIVTFCIVIGAQIATVESLEEMKPIEFPDASSEDALMMFGNMTPMIQIPTTVIVNQIANEGKCNDGASWLCNSCIMGLSDLLNNYT